MGQLTERSVGRLLAEKLDELLKEQQRTNQLLEWLGTRMDNAPRDVGAYGRE